MRGRNPTDGPPGANRSQEGSSHVPKGQNQPPVRRTKEYRLTQTNDRISASAQTTEGTQRTVKGSFSD
ncbi:hypothetical protein PENSTE_c017G01206 [Penicillium steckii]|uniref:Uncharacterized protein n=1 Tax=Penicillium steckii TaxID=303698 RepID=A0A1V6SYA8_9EURO|nr:hypothetical protein PENSTE_c017G01206 [Penicillium steckii]